MWICELNEWNGVPETTRTFGLLLRRRLLHYFKCPLSVFLRSTFILNFAVLRQFIADIREYLNGNLGLTGADFRHSRNVRIAWWAQPVDATHALNRSAGVSYANVFRGRSFNCRATDLYPENRLIIWGKSWPLQPLHSEKTLNLHQKDNNSNGIGDICEERDELFFPIKVKSS